ncbi:NAD-binding protein [Kitasatospora sp. NBC_00240]|uniref:NAD-binding protein n=1 Tax=Kitasatospora sp. NBC_00240 TaxID=2903567 RepID=UPI00225BBD12|nr:NAD(P)-binding protein [Kitasatospora sp. NBC_00240]MCX5209118.1 NAD-binding protein [Kitasatospora sp. NBC_00240]
MVICGDDALAHRLTVELTRLYGQRVTVVLPSAERGHGPQIRALATEHRLPVEIVEAAVLDHAALAAAGVRNAVALALTSEDDQANIHVALRARRINPALRLTVRVYNRKLGRRVEQLLDRAAAARRPDLPSAAPEASTTVLSASATAAPALVAATVAGLGHVVQVDGQLLRVSEVAPGGPAAGRAVATLAARAERPEHDRDEELLPDPAQLPPDGRRTVLELVGRAQAPSRPRRLPGLSALPLGALFSRRLRWSLAALAALVVLFAALTAAISGTTPQHAAWLTVMDVLGVGDPATEDGSGRKILQILTAVSGMLVMPLMIALALEALGAFRSASALRRPPRGLAGHVVLVGLGRVGSRVLESLWELDVPVVCVERDPTALGVSAARAYGVPVVIGDATQEGVLEAAKIGRRAALVTLTGNDSANLEAALHAREANPEVRVVLRLFDDDFAGVVYRALRDSYPRAETRSRSVSFLAAPSFASAMMGRQVIGAIAVGRQVLLIAAVEVTANPLLNGVTVAEAQRPGFWRVLAVDLREPSARTPDLARPADGGPELLWDPAPTRRLVDGDLVVVAATRQGLGALTSGHPV